MNTDEYEELQKELKERKEELKNEIQNKNKNCCLGCSLTFLIILIILISLSVYISKMPEFKPIYNCFKNQTEIYDAIRRYKDLNQKYPESLDIIAKEYLDDKTTLYCPLDKNKEGYEYFNPNKEHKPYIIRCKRHKLFHNQPIPPITITVDGKFAYDFDSFNIETITKNKK